MKKNLLKLAAISTGFVLSHSALADHTGWYAGAGFGQSKVSDWLSKDDAVDLLGVAGDAAGVFDFSGSVSSDSDDTDTAWKIFGGYRFTENLAVEASYIDFGEASAQANASGDFLLSDGFGLTAASGDFGTKVTMQSQAFTLDAVGLFAPTERIDLFVKAGLYYADSEMKVSVRGDFDIGSASGSSSVDDKNANLHAGVGANVWILENLGARLEWETFRKVKIEDAEGDISVISASLLYRF